MSRESPAAAAAVWGGGGKAEKTGSVAVTDTIQGPIRCYKNMPCPIKVSLTVWGEGQRGVQWSVFFLRWLTGNKRLLAFLSLTLLLFAARGCVCCLSASVPAPPFKKNTFKVRMLWFGTFWFESSNTYVTGMFVPNSCESPLEWFPLGCNEMLRVQLISILLPV